MNDKFVFNDANGELNIISPDKFKVLSQNILKEFPEFNVYVCALQLKEEVLSVFARLTSTFTTTSRKEELDKRLWIKVKDDKIIEAGKDIDNIYRNRAHLIK